MIENKIEFVAAFGESESKVKLDPQLGTTSFHIYIDNFFCGLVVKYSTGWMVRFNDRDYSLDDEDAILDRLDIPNSERDYSSFSFLPEVELKAP